MNLQLSENIKRLRREKNLTQEDIATELGISYQAVSRWETGLSYPDIELLPELAAMLGVSMDILFGMDEKSEEMKLAQYDMESDAATNADEQIKLTKKYIAMLPNNTYLKYRLISEYKNKGMEYAATKLEEIRKLCRFIVEHTTDMDWWRDEAINDVISIEAEENVDMWCSELDNRTIITTEQALTNRYYYRDEIDKYNEAIQKDIILSLTHMFADDFCKRDVKTYKNAQSRVEGQTLILKTIDVFRNPDIEIDAWIETRMFAYMRLAAGQFGSGNIEDGYTALEKAVDLYINYDELPDCTELRYNCSLLDLLVVTKANGGKCADALRILENFTGWAWFNGVRNDERFQEQVERLKKHCVNE